MRQFYTQYLGDFVIVSEANKRACRALHEYDSKYKKTAKVLVECAERHGTTPEEMKRHWPCIERREPCYDPTADTP